MIQLIVNADDFGFTRDVNQGIREAHERGILTATTLMANGDAFDDAIELARRVPSLDVGCHVVMVQGESVLHPGRALPATVKELIGALVRREIEPYEEARAQVRKIQDAGIRITHLDTHKHTHLLPPVLDAVARVAREFGIAWVRRPFDYGIATGAARAMRLVRPWFARKLDGLRSTDYFTGFQLTGRLDTAALTRTLERLPEGVTEFMCHPGCLGAELAAAKTRLKQSRADELQALISAEARAVIARRGIRLVAYRDL